MQNLTWKQTLIQQKTQIKNMQNMNDHVNLNIKRVRMKNLRNVFRMIASSCSVQLCKRCTLKITWEHSSPTQTSLGAQLPKLVINCSLSSRWPCCTCRLWWRCLGWHHLCIHCRYISQTQELHLPRLLVLWKLHTHHHFKQRLIKMLMNGLISCHGLGQLHGKSNFIEI